jgi:carbon starvation protein CstA
LNAIEVFAYQRIYQNTVYSYISKHFAQSFVKISKLTTLDTAINLFRIEIQKRLNRKVWKRIRKKQYIKKGDVDSAVTFVRQQLQTIVVISPSFHLVSDYTPLPQEIPEITDCQWVCDNI